MSIHELLDLYSSTPQSAALARALGDDTQKHVMALNLGMIIGLAVRAEGIVKDEKRFANVITSGC